MARGGYSNVRVAGSGSGYVTTSGAGGAGVSVNNAAGATTTVTNASGAYIRGGGSLDAYEGGNTSAANAATVIGNGGVGGAGVAIAGAGTTNLANAGEIWGGYGGYAYVWNEGYQSSYTGRGGAGGAGVSVAGSGTTTITNTGYIHGGYGGNAWSLGVNGGSYTVGSNGAGGAGIEVSSTGTTTVTNSSGATIQGGNGAVFGYQSSAGVGGAGIAGSGFELINSGSVLGGMGGFTRYPMNPIHHVYIEGAGGAGVSVTGGGTTTIINTSIGIIAGGSNCASRGVGGVCGYHDVGGAGGAGLSGYGFTAANAGGIYGGNGKAGVSVGGAGGAGASGHDFTLTNTGNIAGGNGGSYILSTTGTGTVGAGGAGVDALGRVNVITSGSISGGVGGTGLYVALPTPAVQADAVDLSGGGNSLTLESGYSFVGNVVSSSGTTDGGDTLALGGSVDDSFDVSQIVAAAPTDWTGAVQYYGFANYAKVDGNTWTLTNTTTAVTPWTLEGGVLQISSDANLGAPSGGLTFNGGTLENTAAITTSRSITMTGAGTLQTDADLTDSGSVSGSGSLTKTGVGTLTFNGDGSAFTGATNVQTGTLVVGGDGFASATLGGPVTVASGATLGGFGTIGGMDLFGTLSPGMSIGTLNVTGNSTFESGSTYTLDITDTGQSDLLADAGTVLIKGGTVDVQPIGSGWATLPITRYTIVTGTDGVTGTFTGVVNVPTTHYGLFYTSNDVYLVLGANDFSLANAAQTINQVNTAAGITSLGWGSAYFLAVTTLDPAEQRAAFDASSGEFNASQQAALVNDSRFVREQMNKRLRDGDANTDGSATPVASTKLTAWVHGWGHWGQLDGDGNAAQMSDNGDGLLVGADLPVGGSGRVGFTGGAERNTLSVHDRSSRADVTQTWLGAYGGFEQGAFAFRAGVAYAWNQIPAYRDVTIADYGTQHVSSNAIGSTVTGFIEGGWNVQTSFGKITPT